MGEREHHAGDDARQGRVERRGDQGEREPDEVEGRVRHDGLVEVADLDVDPAVRAGERAEIAETIKRQRAAMHPRLYPEVPSQKYVCFYPMDRKRGEQKNWYQLPMAERQRQMAEHGEVGRRYAGKVKQIISGSIGFDDWEWGVDLFADDPVIFKQLIYEMRFDEVSAVYALFGSFFIGLRTPAAEVGHLLAV